MALTPLRLGQVVVALAPLQTARVAEVVVLAPLQTGRVVEVVVLAPL